MSVILKISTAGGLVWKKVLIVISNNLLHAVALSRKCEPQRQRNARKPFFFRRLLRNISWTEIGDNLKILSE